MKKVLILFLLTSSFGLLSQTPDSAEVIRQVDSLIQLNRKLAAEKKYEEALNIIGMAEAKAIKVTGKEHALYATLLFNYGRTYYFMKNDTAAERYYMEAKEIRERVLGLEHPDYAWSLNNLAYLYKANADYQRAEPLFIDAIAIRANHPGKDQVDYISSLIGLAEIYTSTAQYAKAEKLYIEVAGIREKTKGKESRDYATSLTNLGGVYAYMGKHEEREHMDLQILEIWEKVTGKMHPDYAGGLINLANCYRDMARFEESEKLYFEARNILTETQNKQHPYYINCLDALANLYGDINRYDLAEPLYIEAIALREKINGKEHPSYATTLNNMGVMYKKIGNYKNAENLLWESCKIREKVLGKEHPYYAWSLNNLANLYWETGDQAKALALHKQAFEIRKKILKPDHFDYLISLGNLSVLYHEMHDFEQAEKLAEEAIAGIEKLLGTEHYEYLKWKLNLAKIYRDMKRYEASERLFVEIKNAWKKAVGEEHPYYAAHLFNMGSLYTEMGNYERADSLFEESNRLYRLDISKGISYLSERELDYYSYRYNKQIHRFSSFAGLRQNTASAIVASAMDNALFFKGFLLENTRNLEKAIASTSDSTRNIHTRWKICQRRLSAEYSKPLGMRADISKIQSQSDSLEKILVRNVAGFTEARHNIGWRDIQAKLGPDEAAIEFIQFNYINAANERTDSTLYAALLLRPAWKAPRWIQLFEEKQLDSLLYNTGQRKADYVGKLYNHSDRGIIASRGALYDLLWKPLERELAGIKTIYFSPSGLLHRINPGAIPLNVDSTVADKYRLVQLGSTRQLVVPAKRKGDNNDALLLGGIRYETDSTAIRPAANTANTESTLAGSRGILRFVYTDSLLRSGTVWDYLPYTDKEVVAIERIMKSGGLSTQVLKGYAATEESFKDIGQNGAPSPRVLHIATHGFFFPDPKDTTRNDREPVFKISEHPMIRSGLLLAGANHAWETGKPLKPDMEDGILTAYEISQMNLSNTELVVLSACETGLGDIQGNEGVYGLQRAFKIAGARYLMMSLWQVPDRLTAQLMTTFYKKWLEDKMEIPDAFRAAQKEMREQGFDPYYWAGFVLVE